MRTLGSFSRGAVVIVAVFLSAATSCTKGVITVAQPAAGATILGGSTVRVEWTVTNVLSDLKIDMTLDDGATFVNLIPAIGPMTGHQDVTVPNSPADVNNTAFIRISNLDNAAIFGDSGKFNVTATCTRYLTMSEGRAAGAGFDTNLDGSTLCGEVGQKDGSLDANKYAALPRGVIYMANCGGSISGAKADPDSFKGLTLQNGWTVDAVEEFQGERSSDAQTGGDLVTKPAVGSTDATTKFHIWTNRGHDIEKVVAIRIKGPKSQLPFPGAEACQ